VRRRGGEGEGVGGLGVRNHAEATEAGTDTAQVCWRGRRLSAQRQGGRGGGGGT
jgi:hypothetical protein